MGNTPSINQKPTALMLPHGVVFTLFIQQLLMCAFLYDFSVFQYDDAIHFQDGGKAVGDDNGGFILDEVENGDLNLLFGEGV